MAAPLNKPEDTATPETARQKLRRKAQTPTDLGSTVVGGIADGTASAILGTVAKRLIPKVPLLNMILSDGEKQARYGGLLVGALGYVLIHFDALPDAMK